MFYSLDTQVPESLRTDEFVVRPLRITDVELDYDAVVSSRSELWLRSGGTWPRIGFTLAENLADLEMHEHEHNERIAFTYTVMNPTETQCLGCIYINPLKRMLERIGGSKSQIADVQEQDAWVTFWVRQSRLADNLDERLLHSLVTWFKSQWELKRVFFAATTAQERQIALFKKLGMRGMFTLPRHVAYLL